MVDTEIHCHECNSYFMFNLDVTKNGNHVVNCPGCGHEHCRVIENGRITSIRWDQRNGQTLHYRAATTAYSGSIHYYTDESSTSGSINYHDDWAEGLI